MALLSLLLVFPLAAQEIGSDHLKARKAAELKEEISQVIDFFYDLQFEKAAQGAEAVASRHPGHPAGPFYRSIVAYQLWVAEGPKERSLDAFDKDSRETLSAAEKLLPGAEGHYYLGAASGFRARSNAARGRYLRAIPEAWRASKHLKEALRLDPGLEETYLGLGMFHYYSDRIPKAARPFAYLISGVWADRKRGISELERCAEKCGPARMEAKSVLSAIYASDREAQWDKAEDILAELMARYPHNPLYRFRRLYAAERRGDWDQALTLADPNGAWLGALEPALRDPARAHARYRALEILVLSGRAAAAASLIAALEAEPPLGELSDWVLLRRANALHALGREGEAEALYLRIKSDEPRHLAKAFMSRPFDLGPRDVKRFSARDSPL